MAHATRRSSWGRTGLILSLLAGLPLAIAHVGCSSSPKTAAMAPDLASGAKAGGPSITLHLINNCSDKLHVRMNQDTPWTNGGKVKCAAGATCDVDPGTYLIDGGSDGLLFFVGSDTSSATKAEVTYKKGSPGNLLTYDISLITEAGNCPNSCTRSDCCPQVFNHPVRIYTTPTSRCVYCAGKTCPDAFHFPTDATKQVNATAATGLTVEFCPTAACPPTGWRDCNATEQSICHKVVNGAPQDGACTGELTVCCPFPDYGGSHTCFSESGTTSAHPPDANSKCARNMDAYCYVLNQ